jgi:hypothetical protein
MPAPGQVTVSVLRRACWHLDGQHDPLQMRRFPRRNERRWCARRRRSLWLVNPVGDAEDEIDANMNAISVLSENDCVKFPGDFGPADATGVRHREVTSRSAPATPCVQGGAGERRQNSFGITLL